MISSLIKALFFRLLLSANGLLVRSFKTISTNSVLTQQTLAKMCEPEAFRNGIGVFGLGPHLYGQNDKNSIIIGYDGASGRPVINTAARIDLKFKNGIIVLEMGSHDLASTIADEWIFWKAGIADYVVMQRNIPSLSTILIKGYILLVGLSIFFIKNKNQRWLGSLDKIG